MRLRGHQLDGINVALREGNPAKVHEAIQTAAATAGGQAPLVAAHGSAWTDARYKPKRDGQYACLTNYGDIFVVDCIMGEWERPARFNDGEQVEWWIPLPCSREATAHQTPHIAYTPNDKLTDRGQRQ